MNPVNPELTACEAEEFDALVALVHRNLKSVFDVGDALIEIQVRRLYRQTHDTFEAFVADEFGLGRSRTYQLIEAANTVKGMRSTNVDAEAPLTEAHARPLRGLDAATAIEVFSLARERSGDKLTARDIEAARAEITGTDLQCRSQRGRPDLVAAYLTAFKKLEAVLPVLGELREDDRWPSDVSSIRETVAPAFQRLVAPFDRLGEDLAAVKS